MTIQNGQAVTSAILPELIERHRAGLPVLLLCVRAFNAFKQNKAYIPHRVRSGDTLLLQEEDGDEFPISPKMADQISGKFLFFDNDAAVTEHLQNARRTTADALRAAFDMFGQVHTFKPGQLVQWKPGMCDRTEPAPDMPGVILEILDEPVTDPIKENGNHYAACRNDIILGVINSKTGDFAHYYMDSRRFEPFEG